MEFKLKTCTKNKRKGNSKEYKKKYYQDNMEKERASRLKHARLNRDSRRVYAKKYDNENQEKKTAREALRRAKKLKATPKWLTKDHIKQIEDIYRQAKELEETTGEKYHVDHIIPLQGKTVSGFHVPWNLQVITAIENLEKSNKLV
ncbi:HNHc domain containing protein [uncultured Caudovirales phage]|uniref:HNHc domain containing protein n=1 Tax=uncultured Caudovirales phage TaxID=2100421 RepID=A0A6J5KVK5_9CAUD|nr:HNHc domain containing protein [uncultured Caudovirales phage]